MMSDKHHLDMLIFRAQETSHPEEKAAGDVFFEGAHGTRSIHHRNNQRIGMWLFNIIPSLKAQIIR
ncbi:hypothetical protein D3C73_882560 [compost metagenome]